MFVVPDVSDELIVVAFVTEPFTFAPNPSNWAETSVPILRVNVSDQPFVVDEFEETVLT